MRQKPPPSSAHYYLSFRFAGKAFDLVFRNRNEEVKMALRIKTVLTSKRLDEIAGDFESENWHSESALVMPLLEAARDMESLLREYAENQGLGDTQDKIIAALKKLDRAVDRCSP